MSRLVRLYPPAWRERYEEEFLVLLAERQPTLLERFDIVRGALDARIHPQVRRSIDDAPPSPEREADLRLARRLGFAALLGALLWPMAIGVALMGPIRYDDDGAYRDGQAAFPFLFSAVVLLAAGLAGQIVRLPLRAMVARGAAGTAIPFLLLFGLGPWMWPLVLVAIVLITTLAVAGWRSGMWSSAASATVIASGIAVAAVVAVGIAVSPVDRMAGGVFWVIGGLVLIPTWLSIGATLVRRPAAIGPT